MKDMEENTVPEKKLISVIVPVYKVEPYLDRCVESIISQTYRNLEIILVDDGSPDSCGEMCDDWKNRDSRICVIHKPNGGLSDARNAGIDRATGEYIAFVDSDDFLIYNYVEKLYCLSLKYDADVSICGILRLYPEEMEHFILEEIDSDERLYDGIGILKEMYFNNQYQSVIVAWNKLYKTELFKGIRYPYGKINEDGFTTHKLLYKAEKVAVINDKLYAYILTPNSITRCHYNLKHLDDIEGFEVRNAFFYEHKEYELYRLSLSWYIYPLRTQYCMCRYFLPEQREVYHLLWNKFCNTLMKTLLYKEMPLRRKISMTITFLFREFYFRKFTRKNGLEA